MKRHPFNLIELMLALGVIVIGLVSVLALFPIGANANRDAAAGN
jgi:competence protein ComGF